MEDVKDDALSEDALYTKYMIQLYEALTTGKGLSGILSVAEEIFNNPILIADHSFKVLAHIEHSTLDDVLWNKIIESGYYPNDYLKATMNKNYPHVYSSNEPEIMTDDGYQNRYLCKMIVVNGKPVGFSTCIEYEREFTSLDVRLFNVLCKVVASELRCDDIIKQNHKQRYGYFISELLSGPIHADFLKERLKQVGLTLRKNLFVLVAEFEDEKMRQEYLMEYYRSSLEQFVSSGHCIVFRNSLVMLVSLDQKMFVTESLSDSISNQLKDFGMIGGISYRFQKIEELNVYYKQACEAIQVGKKIDKNCRLFDYGSLYFYHILDLISDMEDLRKFCNPKLIDIIEYDKVYNTSYAMTANIFLSTSMNPALTANKLNIHRNTIDYRIKKMHELFDLDFNDNETAFSFEFSFRILRFLAAPPFGTI